MTLPAFIAAWFATSIAFACIWFLAHAHTKRREFRKSLKRSLAERDSLVGIPMMKSNHSGGDNL